MKRKYYVYKGHNNKLSINIGAAIIFYFVNISFFSIRLSQQSILSDVNIE